MYLRFIVSRQGISMLGTVVYIVYISPRAMRISGLYQFACLIALKSLTNYLPVHVCVSTGSVVLTGAAFTHTLDRSSQNNFELSKY